MKKPIMWVAALLTASCTPALKVEVANTTPTERDDETVEIAWSEVAALKGVTPDNIVVLNDDNEQIPSQVLFRGGTEPQALIFQTDADPMESKRFKLVTGQRENYPAEAFGRTVPERYDDYAWENNKVAYRLYGPALETSPEKLVTPGIDVWVKCTDKLVIDEWYARGNYHHNYGDGMDCYKVGVTLGSGASLPFAGGKFWMMGHNYATARTLDNGPIRTSVELTYAPFDGRRHARDAHQDHLARRQPALQPHGQHLRRSIRRDADRRGLRAPRRETDAARRRLDGPYARPFRTRRTPHATATSTWA